MNSHGAPTAARRPAHARAHRGCRAEEDQAQARAVLLWHALAHNLQHMIALDLVPQP
jgi:hypothetical protein